MEIFYRGGERREDAHLGGQGSEKLQAGTRLARSVHNIRRAPVSVQNTVASTLLACEVAIAIQVFLRLQG